MRNPLRDRKARLRLLCWLLLAGPVLARVGGGQSYGGSSSSSSSSGSSYSGGYSSGGGGGSGDGELVGFLLELVIRLIFYYPQIGIPLLLVGCVFYFASQRGNSASSTFTHLQNWSAQRGPESPRQYEQPARRSANFRGPLPPESGAFQLLDLNRIKQSDPNFSRPLFLDFVNLLYCKIHLLSGEALATVGAYLTTSVRGKMEKAADWRQVVVGSLRVTDVSLSQANQKVVVEIEANLEGEGTAIFVVDRLVLQRKPGSLTAEPAAVYSFACPKCGSNAPVDPAGRCSNCDSQVNNGRFGWLLTDLSREKTEPRVQVELTSGGDEAGTDLPTVRDANLEGDLERLKTADPDFSQDALVALATTTFLTLQQAWSDQRWQLARPLESDYLFGQHQLWMDAYARQGLRNVLDEVEVKRVELVRIEIDRYFESATLRMFASMRDSTVRLSDGVVVSGDATRPRSFSEYWTFIRRSGVTTQARELASCPNCGAKLDRVTVAGVCEYCDANITRGDYDWILSRIEQDEAYQ